MLAFKLLNPDPYTLQPDTSITPYGCSEIYTFFIL